MMESERLSVLSLSTRGGQVRLIDELLGEQGDLTAVERFAQFHEGANDLLQGRFYSSLLPGRVPGPGQQYAFEVDLDRCSGCKACVAACHSLNGLDEGETWREVGLIIGGPPGLPVLQHVTSACHHCLDPACLNVCPVDAYEKDPVTGIVKHLDDQCFGCQYCTLACPYDAPKFHAGKGIVRKCDMCSDRLEVGEAPACVQGCPHEAIRICVVDRAEVVAIADANEFLPSAPGPDYTLPTTRYATQRPLQGAVRAADHYRNEPEHAHWPLVFMLVLTQGSNGGFLADFAARTGGLEVPLALPTFSLVLGLTGIAASLFHLGRPRYAYRALIGLRHSWLSREVAAFGLFANLALAYTAAVWFQPGLATALAPAVAVVGVAAVFCSVMVYHVVRRPFWHATASGTKFAGTTVVLGLAALMVCRESAAVCFGLMAAMVAKMTIEAVVLNHLRDPLLTPLRRTAVLLRGPLARVSVLRLSLGSLGGIVLPLIVAVGTPPMVRVAVSGGAFLVLLCGELAERYLFFAAVVRPKMPGGVSS
jgi:formate dehydrogenase iron-sulfur subunit